MNNEQIRALMSEIAPVFQEYVSTEVGKAMKEKSDLIVALQSTNQSLVDELGKISRQLQATQTSVMELQQIPLAKDGLDGKDGKDGPSIDDVRAMIAEEVTKLPVPVNGKDGKDGLPGVNGADGAPGERGADGTSVYLSDVAKHIEEHFYMPFTQKLEKALEDAIRGNREVTDAFLKGANDVFEERLIIWEKDVAQRLDNVKDGMPGPAGPAGKNADEFALVGLISSKVTDAVKVLEQQIDFKLSEATEEKAGLIEMVKTAIAGIKNGVDGRDGKDGESVDLTVLDQVVTDKIKDRVMEIAAEKFVAWDEMTKEAIANVKDGVDGKDGESVDLVALGEAIDDKITAATAEIIGKSIANWDTAINNAVARIKDGKDGIDGKDGRDGANADMDSLTAAIQDLSERHYKELRETVIREYIEPAIKAIPAPENGKDGRDGKDGVNLAGMMIDRVGHLQATLSNGEIKDLGPIMGADGLGFEDLRVEQKSTREFSLVFSRDGREKSFAFKLPIVLDQGVYKSNSAYSTGDGVTYGGSYWIAKGDGALGTPGASDDWRLAVKKGRDAREPVKTVEPRKDPVKIGDSNNG
jgi:hypothetical protein